VDSPVHSRPGSVVTGNGCAKAGHDIDQREPWEGLVVATLISGEKRGSGHEGMGAHKEIREDHLALTTTLAIGQQSR
jgi:hypothetical protein